MFFNHQLTIYINQIKSKTNKLYLNVFDHVQIKSRDTCIGPTVDIVILIFSMLMVM